MFYVIGVNALVYVQENENRFDRRTEILKSQAQDHFLVFIDVLYHS